MLALSIICVPVIGSSPQEASKDALALSVKLDCFLDMKWNGRSILVSPDMSIAAIVMQIQLATGRE